MRRILVFIILISCFTNCAQKAEDSIRLIPEGYVGPVLIIFNQEDGEPVEYEGDKRMYRIPKNGILKTQFKPNFGVQNIRFFYVDAKNKREEIQFVLVHDKDSLSNIENKEGIYVFGERAPSQGVGFAPEIGKYNTPPTREFYIGNLLNIEGSYRELSNFSNEHLKDVRISVNE